MTTLFLLGPHSPMPVQGQAFSSSRPFDYFADHEPELAENVAAGREWRMPAGTAVAFRSIPVEEKE